jgi:hypothetical protein
MIAKQSLSQILAAADQSDDEDVAIRGALYIALARQRGGFSRLQPQPASTIVHFRAPHLVASSRYESVRHDEQTRRPH